MTSCEICDRNISPCLITVPGIGAVCPPKERPQCQKRAEERADARWRVADDGAEVAQ